MKADDRTNLIVSGIALVVIILVFAIAQERPPRAPVPPLQRSSDDHRLPWPGVKRVGQAPRPKNQIPPSKRRVWIGGVPEPPGTPQPPPANAGLARARIEAAAARDRFMTMESRPVNVDSTGWRMVASWSGNGTKQTESFSVGSNWKIAWKTWPGAMGSGNFQIYVYRGRDDLVGVAANVVGKDQDESFQHQRGTYYLNVNAIQPWEISVSEPE